MKSKFKKNNIAILWVDRFSVSILWKFFFLKFKGKILEIRFLEKSLLASAAFKCLIFLCIVEGKLCKIDYSMGDIRSGSGSSLHYESLRIASQAAASIVTELKELSAYAELSSVFSQDKVDLYLEKLIFIEIVPFTRLLCIVRYYDYSEKIKSQQLLLLPEVGYFSFLKNILSDKKIKIVPYAIPFDIHLFIKKYLNWLYSFVAGRILANGFGRISSREFRIAVHYQEGVDLTRRSDLSWYPLSNIRPENIIIYFDKSSAHLITNKHIQQIDYMGIRWIVLRWVRRMPFFCWKSVWQPPVRSGNFRIKRKYHDNHLSHIEKWVYDMGDNLISMVEFWKKFYQKFNIKVHYDAEESVLQNVAQNIALDIVGGVRVGKQRSEIMGIAGEGPGYHPDHIFFSWNDRGSEYLMNNRNRNEYCITSGFPFDAVFKKDIVVVDSMRKDFAQKGVKFIIALYDNSFSENIHYSKKMMLSFYRKFLEWVIDDRTIGLIIKSKKPIVLNSLPEIKDLLKQALDSGRCVRMHNEIGRLPSDAAHVADIAVGIGISSAVVESVITGCKGVHCDFTGLRTHIFYTWGYQKIIFDDIDMLAMALKRYKEDPEDEPYLGDWSPYIDKLDPFRDGRGGERMGTYMRWLLESFDRGDKRDEAIQYANTLYANQWGEDKVIEMIN